MCVKIIASQNWDIFLRHGVHSSEMRPNNELCNIVVTDGTNQSHNISEIYNDRLYESTIFLTTRHRYAL